MKRTDYLFDDDETPIEGETTVPTPEDDNAPVDGHPDIPTKP